MIKILIAADFVPNDRTATEISSSDYSCLDEVSPLLQEVDYSIVNFESPVVTRVAKPIDKTGPSLRCSGRAMACLAHTGFKCVTLANNHFRDQGQIGVEDTIAACKKYGLDYVGGGLNLTEARRILYKEIKGEKIAIINFCENEWSIAGEDYGGSAPLNPVRNYYAIQEAREKADFVIVIVHGGIEGYQYPTPRMVDTYRFFVDAGADAVINHHQHCFSGYEEYKGKPIFYGLGNFCFDRKGQRGSIWNEGYMVKLRFVDGSCSYELLPYIQCDEIPAVVMESEEKRKLFEEKISEINEAIKSPELLQEQFQKQVESIYEYRLLALEPINNVVVKQLQKKKLFPRQIRNEQKKSMFMRLRCESNNELLIEVLKKYFGL